MSEACGVSVTVIKTEVDSEGELEIAEESSDESSDEPINPQVVMTTNYHDSRLPMLEDFGGPHNFSCRLPTAETSSIKPSWEYSDVFNQVFIKMDRVLVVQFSLDAEKETIEDLYIRAVLVYSSADHIFAPVNRCAVHAIEEDPLSKSHHDKEQCLCPFYGLAGHVVRCKSSDAMYCFDPKSGRHSVICPVKTSPDILYYFRCKNSCPKGMHRRSTKLVFTLEDGAGKMLGRTSLDVKISSCPRRDQDKMEKSVKGLNSISKSTIENGHTPNASKIRKDNNKIPSPVKMPEERMETAEDDDDDPPISQLPGEVIMKMRSEVRNIRQALVVIERRCSHLVQLLRAQENL